MLFTKAVQPRVTSEKAHPRTIKDRSLMISNTRNVVSGGESSSQVQLANKIATLAKSVEKTYLRLLASI